MAEEEVQQQMEGDEESVPVMVDRSKLTPNMRHYLQMSKLHSQNEYAKGPVGLYGQRSLKSNKYNVLKSRITAETNEQRIFPRIFEKKYKKIRKIRNFLFDGLGRSDIRSKIILY